MQSIYRCFFLLILLATLSACGADKESKPIEIVSPKQVQVELLELKPIDLKEEFTLPGSLEAWKDLRLAAEIAGPIEWTGPTEGDQIKIGENLVQIDVQTLKANRDSIKADYTLRKKTLTRLKQLTDEKLVSFQEYDNAQGAFEVANANLNAANVMLAKGTLRSPIDGVIEETYADPGEFVGVGDPLVRVVQIDQLKINVDLPEKDVSFLVKGAEVTVTTAKTFDVDPQKLFGIITYIGYVADPVTRTYRVRIAIDNSRRKLRPGMIVRAKFLRRKLKQIIAVPLYAVVERDGRKFVFIQQAQRAEQKNVKLGATLNGQIVVLAGLQAGDRLVVKGQQLLQDAALINPVESR